MPPARVIDETKNYGKVRIQDAFNFTAAVTANIPLVTGDGADLPAVPFNLSLFTQTATVKDPHDDTNREVVRVTAAAGDTLTTIVREQEGTSASSHVTTSPDICFGIVGVTKKTLDDIDAKIATIDSVGFHATHPGSQSVPSGAGGAILDWSAVKFDKTSDFDLVNNKFVAPYAMLLWLSYRIATVAGTDNLFVRCNVRVNTVADFSHFIRFGGATTLSLAQSGCLDLALGDDVDILLDHEESGSLTVNGGNFFGFGIRKL